MIVAIRISGRVGVAPGKDAILYNLRLRKKYACVLLRDKHLVEKVSDKVSFGEIDKDTLLLLISKRGKKIGNKPVQESSEIIIKKLEEGKNFDSIGMKPFFSLQPPRGGFKKSTKLAYPRGVLGENKNINDLVRRML